MSGSIPVGGNSSTSLANHERATASVTYKYFRNGAEQRFGEVILTEQMKGQRLDNLSNQESFEQAALKRDEGVRQRLAVAVLIVSLVICSASLVLAYQVAPVLPLLVASCAAISLFVFAVVGLIEPAGEKSPSFLMSLVAPTQRLVRFAGQTTAQFWRFATGCAGLAALCWVVGRGGVRALTVRCGSNALAVRIADATGQIKNETCDETRSVRLAVWQPLGCVVECAYKNGYIGAPEDSSGAELECPPTYDVSRNGPALTSRSPFVDLTIEQFALIDDTPVPRVRATLFNRSDGSVRLQRLGIHLEPVVQYRRTGDPDSFVVEPLETIDVVIPADTSHFEVELARLIQIGAHSAATLDLRFLAPGKDGKWWSPNSDSIRKVSIDFVVGDRAAHSTSILLAGEQHFGDLLHPRRALAEELAAERNARDPAAVDASPDR